MVILVLAAFTKTLVFILKDWRQSDDWKKEHKEDTYYKSVINKDLEGNEVEFEQEFAEMGEFIALNEKIM